MFSFFYGLFISPLANYFFRVMMLTDLLIEKIITKPLTMKKTKTLINNQVPDTALDLSNAYILNGNTLELQTTPFELDENQGSPIEKKFKSRKEYEEILLQNGKVLFGNDTLLINTQLKKDLNFTGTYTPDALLFDFKDPEKSKCYLIETMYSIQDFYGHFLQRITGFFNQNSNEDIRSSFIELICKQINKNYHFKKKLVFFIGKEAVLEFINRMISGKPPVLFIMETPNQKFEETLPLFSPSWSKLVKLMIFRKLSVNGELLCSMSPSFDDIDKTEVKVKEKILKSTEEDHLKTASDDVRNAYKSIKMELLKVDKQVEFNPKQYYISVRKNKNIAFFHINRKRISLVVVNPEAETRKSIKHHEIKTLTEKVQKFWNGPSCTVIIENDDKLNEVINLLKKLIAKS